MMKDKEIHRKVYDCFIFYNELDLLEIRLNEMNSVVDYFVIVESEKTFQNRNKILYYDENKDNESFSKFKDKIIHLIVPGHEFNDDSWYNEEHQFNFIKNGLKDASNNDLIILGFLDEIPKASVIKTLLDDNFDGMSYLLLDFFYFFLDTRYTDFGFGDYWYGNLITLKKYISTNIYKDVMKRGKGHNTISNAGWHFSFLGNAAFILDKINSYAHTEFNHLSEDNIKNFIDNLQDPLGRNGSTKFYGHEKIENLPTYVQENIEKYKKYLHNNKINK